ncbi:MAG: alpha/beta hydrolase [Parvularculaceae bacterium]
MPVFTLPEGPALLSICLMAARGAGALSLLGASTALADECPASAQTEWLAPAAKANGVTGTVEIEGARISYHDTGGGGEPIIFGHAASGSAESWAYQQSEFASAGYRVITYSRPGHRGSPILDEAKFENDPVDSLNSLANALGLNKFHYVGHAAGGTIGPGYALRHGDRLLSLTLANTTAGIKDEAYAEASAMLMPPGFREMPADYRELSPSFRLSNPEGRREWMRIAETSRESGPLGPPPKKGGVYLSELEDISVPVLIIAGDADAYLPPARARQLAARFPNAKTVTIREAGHSANWEQPIMFNCLVLEFLQSHPASP